MAEDNITFRLLNGHCGELAREARRTYDAIVYSNLGIPLSDGLTGKTSNGQSSSMARAYQLSSTDDQVRSILLKSRLPEEVMEHIWSLTEQIDSPGREDGTWTQLEVYVTLNFVQAQEKLSLNGMQSQFAGPFRSTTNKITRRTSFAPASRATIRNSLQSPALELPTILSRSQSASSNSNLQEGAFVGAPTTQTSQAKVKGNQSPDDGQDHEAPIINHDSRRQRFSLETLKDLEGNLGRETSRKQLGTSKTIASTASEGFSPENAAEAPQQNIAAGRRLRLSPHVDRPQGPWSPLGECIENHRRAAPPTRLVSDCVMGTSRNYPSSSIEVSPSNHLLPRSQTVTSSSSRESTPAEKRQRLADLTAAYNHKIVIAPMLNAPGPPPRFGSTVDECDAHSLLVVQREGTKQPGSGLGSLLKTRTEKEKAKDKSSWKFSKKECNQALKKVIEQGRAVGIAEALLDLGADPVSKSFHCAGYRRKFFRFLGCMVMLCNPPFSLLLSTYVLGE